MSGLAFENVVKTYKTAAGRELPALRGVSFEAEAGQRVAVVGRSGSGKSTLLHLAAGIDVATSGHVLFDGKDLAAMSDHDRTLLRRSEIGLVFQFFHLVAHLSVAENVALPNLIASTPSGGGPADRASMLLERVGLADRSADHIQELSGGEQQKVAICRALVHRPSVLLADEPTGNLDDDNAALVMRLLFEMASEEGATLLYATHSRSMAARADSAWKLHSGLLEGASRPVVSRATTK